MAVRHDDLRAVAADRPAEDVGDAHDAGVERPPVEDLPVREHFIFGQEPYGNLHNLKLV